MAMRIEATYPDSTFGRDIKVLELTVSEIRQWMAGGLIEAIGGADVVDLSLLDDVTLVDLKHLTDITDEEIGGAAPSQLEDLLGFCKKVNKHFFELRKKMAEAGARVMVETPSAP